MPANPDSGVSSPPLRQFLGESRFLLERIRSRFSEPELSAVAKGNGQPIMIVPGFGATDAATAVLVDRLNRCGFAAHGWGQGRNTGMSGKLRSQLAERVDMLHQQYQCKVSLVGWSLGGVFVREMARHQADGVAHVFTLGSPFNITPAANNMLPLFRVVNLGRPVNLDWDGFGKRAVPPPVPCTAIYSKSDGVVAWQTSCEDEADNTENVEVDSTHFGMPMNLRVLEIIAERVARVEKD